MTDPEILEDLELNARTAAIELEWLLEQSMELTLRIMAARESYARCLRERDIFKVVSDEQ